MVEKLLDLEEACTKIGVTPEELYLRQNGMCYLTGGTVVSGVIEDIYCTDGVDKVPTRFLANPTIECSRCLSYCILKRTDETARMLAEIRKLSGS